MFQDRLYARLWFVPALLFALLALLTSIDPHWLEALGLDPDGGSGSAENGLVLLCAGASVLSALVTSATAARTTARRLSLVAIAFAAIAIAGISG
jgi:hypothetical protein